MKLSELKILYKVFNMRDHIKDAIRSIENDYVGIEEIEQGDYFLNNNTYYSLERYVITRDGDIIDRDDSFFCEGHEEYFHEDERVSVYEGRNETYYSRSWVERCDFIYFNGNYYDDDALERHEIVYVEDIGEYGYADDNWYHSEDGSYYSYEQEAYVRGYHNGGYSSVDFNNKSKYKIGFEIEKEDEDVKQSIRIDDFEDETDGVWRKEEDGSLNSCSGFELISPTFEFDIEKIFEHIESNDVLVKHINAKYSTSCGGHIHLSKEGLNGYELFDKIKGYTPLLYSLYYGRVDKNYSKGKSNKDLIDDNEKYQAIKIHSDRIEFRIISAVPNVNTLKWRSKLIMMMINNPTNDVVRGYYNVDTKFNKLLKQMYSEDNLSILKDRFIKFTRQFEGIEINKNNN
jgi:hypothetical protein